MFCLNYDTIDFDSNRKNSELTVITHVYNEEYLLPFWLKHHRKLFDHGVIIDYGSTDRTAEIVKDLVPEWDFVQSKNEFFVEPHIGDEVEFYETQFKGWKMVLNVTEFVLAPSLQEYVYTLERNNLMGICTNGVVMVDRPEEINAPLDPDRPLIAQRTFGYFEKDVMIRPSTTRRPVRSRSRALHRSDRGRYLAGRHYNGVTERIDGLFFLCWFGWSPFNDQFKARKGQIQNKVDKKQTTDERWADLYVLNDEKIEGMYKEEAVRSYNLLDDSNYKLVYDKCI